MSDRVTLRSARKMKDLTIEEVAKYLEITVTTWRNYENNKTRIPAIKFLKYCDWLDIEPKKFDLS
ncbi:helix-turn-helix transcriptional regulator [Erysipelothrix sp. HDW6A]|uniref:helix-turn-helix domain-containing protein n=1 Tax=Erysipelothrix sp. HDW6A TaxID=2714928 RepID=UPI00140D239A|nr:helix-turn-helix transcriptional regulator [Erysipelothrix sp. HDW6A]QIK56629.1 helix-turn-helix transcriptional regulator [Erysipelothrix sp. HDW6A]